MTELDRKNIQREYNRKYYLNNRSNIRVKQKSYWNLNKDKLNAKQRESHYLNINQRKAYQKAYRLKNSESIKAYRSEYYYRNHEETKRLTKIRRNKPEHKSYMRSYLREYKKKRMKHDLGFKLRNGISTRIRMAMKSQYLTKNTGTSELIGCSLLKFIRHLESKFTEGMSWDNYGCKPDQWNIDHIYPCSWFDLTDPNQQRMCFHYTNTRPMWAIQNIQKGNKYVKSN